MPPSHKQHFPASPEGARAAPRPGGICNPSSESLVCPGAFGQIDVPRRPVCPRPPHDTAESCQPKQSHNVPSLRHHGSNLIHPWRLATGELFDCLSDLCQGYQRVFCQVFRLCLLPKGRSSQFQTLLKMLLSLPDYISGTG